ncbi:alpha/beta fold hydrolase [Marinobacter sp. CHS3-4]|uniref:alpha/beta hydrolase n=1 Tax=Marinobacter sp. CHS3-4 TaxID=3045174 RepID=UPI0024B545A0|nr:alpha/beta fold hydrolase [Marinobacter sp. CHS3-4]MDI9243912.1 alpha/beta fold hydrolase [Marinobacter sp. CHS3-4]
MHKALFTLCLISLACLLAACASNEPRADQTLYEPADSQLTPVDASDFDAYLADTRRHLEANLVALPGFTREQQIEWNMPFKHTLPDTCTGQPSRGILMIHGLSDSPFVFRDFARVLAKDCVEVRTVLLQGHGTRPGDMIEAKAAVWRKQVRTHFYALADDVEVALIGGFSLGGALATELALSEEQPRPAGLVTLAPAWELSGLDNYLWLASTANLFLDFVEEEPELNPVKYESLTINAAVQLTDVLEGVDQRFSAEDPSDLPLFLVATEADSVIDLSYLMDSFLRRFDHPDNRMIVFRDQRREWPYKANPAIVLLDGYRPDLNILEFSHQSLPASPDNELYGIGRPLQRCLEPNQMSLAECRNLAPDKLWFSAYSDGGQPVPTSRLTYNPDFHRVARALSEFIRTRDIP